MQALSFASKVIGKNHPKVCQPPAIVLINPKYPRNLGAVIRSASAFGIHHVLYTGDRIKLDEKERLPREERMRGYASVELLQFDRPLELFERCTPVAVELRPGSEQLPQFQHPEDAVYLFGPEDGSMPEVYLRLCHRFVAIPAAHCLNLSSAVTAVLYDRQSKLQPDLRLEEALREERVWHPLDVEEEG